jgi:hypothetical protein
MGFVVTSHMSDSESSAPVHGRHAGGPLFTALIILLFIEAAGMIAVTAWLVVDLFTLTPDSYTSAIAILVLAILASIWISAVAVSSIRRAPWIRAGAVIWQILQLSVAVGALQGTFARADIGLALLIPSLLGLVLLFMPPVVAAVKRPDEYPAE